MISVRWWRWSAGLVLVAVPACGLQDYEALMSEAQKRDQFFRAGEKLLAGPVNMPKRKVKDKEGKETEQQAGNVFFRPPKGIAADALGEPRADLLWRYPGGQNTGGFAFVEMAFASESKDFAANVLGNYRAVEQPKPRAQEFHPPEYQTPLVFDTWEFDDTAGYTYSVNILRSNQAQVAVVFVFSRDHGTALRPAIERSLQSLAVDRELAPARQRYQQKSPWRLKSKIK